MNCNFNYTRRGCNGCTHFVKTIKIGGDETEVLAVIPEMALCNKTTLCICFAQDIPELAKEDAVLSIQIGTDVYPVATPCGNFIYGDQLRSNKVYCFKFGTDTKSLFYRGGWRLCPTKHQFNCIPIPPAPAKAKSKPKTTKPEKTEE